MHRPDQSRSAPGREGEPVVTARSWYALALLTLIHTSHYIDRSVVGIALESIRQEFRLSDAQLGILTGLAYSLPFALLVLPIGALVDRVDRTRLIAAIALIWSAATAACGLAASFPMLIAMRAAVGAAEAGASPTAMSLMASFFPQRLRGRAISIFFLASSIGTILSFGIGGAIVGALGWRTAFVIAGVPGIVVAAVTVATLRDPGRASPEKASARPTYAGLARIWLQRPDLLHLTAAGVLATAIVAGMWSWTAAFFIRVHGYDVRSAGVLVATGAGLCGAAGSLAAGQVADRLGRDRPARALILPAVAMLLLAVIGVAIAFAASHRVAAALFLLWSLLATTFMAPYFATALSLVPADQRGGSTAALQLLNNLVGYGGGPMIVGLVSAWTTSLRWGVAALALFGLWAGTHFFLAMQAARSTSRLTRSIDKARDLRSALLTEEKQPR